MIEWYNGSPGGQKGPWHFMHKRYDHLGEVEQWARKAENDPNIARGVRRTVKTHLPEAAEQN